MRKLEAALRSVGAVLLRQKKHRVYRLPNGQKLTLASSPSDSRRGEKNALTDVYRAAGIDRPKPVKSEKPKTEKPGRRESVWGGLGTMADVMVKSPEMNARLQHRLKELEVHLAMAEERAVRWRSEADEAVEQRAAAVTELCRVMDSRWMRVGVFLRAYRKDAK